MKLISVNIGQEQSISTKSGKTGIYKEPVSTPVAVTASGLSSDAICDTQNHGGVDQAVYIYGQADYAWWSQQLGADLAPGTFGENLTISDFESAKFNIGDRLHFTEIILEVTAPRVPCVTLAARMGDSAFVKRFRQAERPGLYCRVIQMGHVQAGESVRLEPYQDETVSALEMFRDFYQPQLDATTLKRYLNAPIAVRDREDKEKRLAEMRG